MTTERSENSSARLSKEQVDDIKSLILSVSKKLDHMYVTIRIANKQEINRLLSEIKQLIDDIEKIFG